MSDNWLRYVPTDRQFQPTPAQARAAEAVLASLLPQADSVCSEFTEHIAFVDPGANWSGVHCSGCGADAEAWWGDAVSFAAEERFTVLTLAAPCCGRQVSLDGLRYGWPCAFGRFVLEAANPNEKSLSAAQIELISTALGCPVQEVAVHI